MAKKETSLIVLFGPYEVGKTNIINKFVKDEFSENYIHTKSLNCSKKETVIKERPYTFLIWELEGNTKMSNLFDIMVRECKGCFFVSDAGRPETREL